MALWLNETDVHALLGMRDLIQVMERTLAAFSSGNVNQPVRSVIEVASDSFFASMPAHIRTPPAVGSKLVTVFAGNTQRGLPTHLATILLFDPETGALVAVMDGRYITEARTAAVSAVSVNLLGAPGATRLALIGSGVQAHSHLEALRLVRTFREVRCWSPTRERLERFASQHGGVVASKSAHEAVEGADVIVLVTSSTTPVIESGWVKPGAHVVSVGACRPNHREMDPELVKRSRLIVDSRAAAVQESGDVLTAGAQHIAAELGQVVTDPGRGRTAKDQVTVFKSLGLACEDVAAAELAFRRAVEAGRGVAFA